MVRRTLSALTLVAAIGAPALFPTVALAQASVSLRIYDKSHKDYHPWTNDEDRAYRQYLTDHHRKYQAISRTSKKQQAEYWQYRHQH